MDSQAVVDLPFTREQIQASAAIQRDRVRNGELDVTLPVGAYLNLCDMALQTVTRIEQLEQALSERDGLLALVYSSVFYNGEGSPTIDRAIWELFLARRRALPEKP